MSPLRSATNRKVNIAGTVLLHIRIEDAIIRVVFGDVRSLAVPILLRTSFNDRFFKGIFPPKHDIVLYNSALVPILATVIKTEENLNQHKQEVDIVENVTVAQQVCSPPPLMRVSRQRTIPPTSKCVVLVTTEARGLLQVDALPDWNFI